MFCAAKHRRGEVLGGGVVGGFLESVVAGGDWRDSVVVGRRFASPGRGIGRQVRVPAVGGSPHAVHTAELIRRNQSCRLPGSAGGGAERGSLERR